MFEKLMKEIEYAKTSIMPRQNLFETYGRITMARELNAISKKEYFKLNNECVCKGINNPQYFN